MKKLVIAALVSAQLTAAQPALAAARMGPGEQTRVGVFAGFQLRMPLGGARAEAPRASLGIAPAVHSQRADGESRMRIAEGLQFSLRPSRPAEVTFAWTRLDRFRLTPGGQSPDGMRAGVSTLGWIGIAVGATVVLVVAAGAICLSDSDCIPDDD